MNHIKRLLNKNFIIFFIILGVVVVIIGLYSFWFFFSEQYTRVQISDLSWPQGSVLVVMDTAENADDVGVPHGLYIFGSSGEVHMRVDGDFQTNTEFLSPSSILVTGKLLSTQPKAHLTQLFFVTPHAITSIVSEEKEVMSEPSLSSSQKYLRYKTQSKLCITHFSLQQTRGCDNVLQYIPTTWKNANEFFIDSEWMYDADQYVIRIRSMKNHSIEQSSGDNTSSQRIQNEIARFLYNPETQKIEQRNIDEGLRLKTRDVFITEANKSLTFLFTSGSDYQLIPKHKDRTIDILQKSTHMIAKLTNAPFFGDMAGFDLYTFQ